MREIRDTLRDMDRKMMLERCEDKLVLIAEVATGKTWAELWWDRVMDLGLWQVKGLRNLSRVLSAHGGGTKPCPRCDLQNLGGTLSHRPQPVTGSHNRLVVLCQDSCSQNHHG